MKTFIANFGKGNYEWPVCLKRGTIATMNDVRVQAFWEAGDREAYIQNRMREKTVAGIAPTRPVASRWFNLMSIVSGSSGDIWIHREKNQLWWTISRPDPPFFERKIEPTSERRDVVVCHKPCDSWSSANRKGSRLDWNGLHPKAREFLTTESTLQRLGEDNAAYAFALIDGRDLTPWHSRAAWKAKVNEAGKGHGPATVFNAWQRAAVRMVQTALDTASASNGQQVLRTIKNKDVLFASNRAFEDHVHNLIGLQDGLCAITSLTLQFDGDCEDSEMLCSLDRINSTGHYAPDNLQIVCRFVNRWKNASDDEGFRRLIAAVRSVGMA